MMYIFRSWLRRLARTAQPARRMRRAWQSARKPVYRQLSLESLEPLIMPVAPVVNAGPDIVQNALGTFTSAGAFTDPDADSWTATVDYGDGSGTQPLTLAGDKTFALSHTYAADGTYTVTVAVGDGTDVGTGSATVKVNRFTVDTAADNVAADGLLSLREAIQNADAHPGTDTIGFNIPGTGVQTIAPLTVLPVITEAMVIDGYTQPGSGPNTLATGDNAMLKVVLTGTQLGGGADGLTITAAGSTVRGLAITGFGGSGIALIGPTATGNLIAGNFIGTADGVHPAGNGVAGVRVAAGAGGNTIGGPTPQDRNLISGNGGPGVLVVDSSGAVIQGSLVGTDATGTLPLLNQGPADLSATGSNASLTLAGVIAGDGVSVAAGTIHLAGDLASLTGFVTLTGTTVLDADVTVTANQVKFVGPLNGQGHALTVVGSADFEGAISGLSNLSLSGLASLNAGTVVSTGALVYAGPVTLAGDTTITTPSVTFRDTVDGAHALVVTGAATFGGAVGGITPLASLSVGSAAGPDAVIRLNGGGITTAGGQTYSAPVMLGADTTLSSTTAGNIRFTAAATIDGPHALAVNTAGVSTFAAPVGEGAPLASFTTDPAGRTVLGDSVTTTGSTTTSSRSSSRCSPS